MYICKCCFGGIPKFNSIHNFNYSFDYIYTRMTCFHICNGVKQGVVLSTILFALKYDKLIAKLASNGYGC